MSDDYLWDRSGVPDPDAEELDDLLGPLAHDAPLENVGACKESARDPARATAHEPAQRVGATRAAEEALNVRRRAKGKMIFSDKRIIGVTALAVAAIALMGVTAVVSVTLYKSRNLARARDRQENPSTRDDKIAVLPFVKAIESTPHFPPVAPMTNADLAITAGESVRIHAPFGAVDVEIQSKCEAEVELTVVSDWGHPGSPPRGGFGHRVDAPAIIAGTDRPDGRASTFHLAPGLRYGQRTGFFEYTSHCVGEPPIHGVLVVDRDDAREPIGAMTNASVFNDDEMMVNVELGIHVFGTVLPGAIVSIGAKPLALQAGNLANGDPIMDPTFAADVPVSVDHAVAAVRVDDARGTHFYVIHPAEVLIHSCATAMAEPRQVAASLDEKGDDMGALTTIESAMSKCKPDHETWSLAFTYACKAGEIGAAQTYWHKLPGELRKTLEPMCAKHQITREKLDAP